MNEYDQLGRDAFLAKYRFGSANRYFVKRNGRRYDSKAIYGVAHQIQYPEEGPITPRNFSGGELQVQGPLEALGFEFEVTPTHEVDGIEAREEPVISTQDVQLIASSRSKQRYSELSAEEHAAYVRVSGAVQALGELADKSVSSAETETNP